MKKEFLKIGTICLALIVFSCKKEAEAPAAAATTETEAAPVTEVAGSASTDMAGEKLAKGDYCFLKAENKDTTSVRFRVLSEDDIRGEMIWSPWQKDGAVGKLTGKLNAENELELVYDYTIEGSRQTETKIMKVAKDKLYIKRGELVDPKNDGNMVFKDAKTATYKDILDKTSCN